MEEPTAALSRHEVDQLFLVVDDLRKRGVAMKFVGHRMEEIYEVSDRVVVLRDGKVIAGAPIDEMPRDRAIQLMVGAAVDGPLSEAVQYIRRSRYCRRGAFQRDDV